MGTRIDLQSLLETTLGSRYVYFQPPATVELKYPCIIYKRSDAEVIFADNSSYKNKKKYSLTVIDRNPDSIVLDKVEALPYCSFSRHYASDDLNHDVYDIFY